MNVFPPTRDHALARLAEFIPHAGRRYAAKRNYDLGREHPHVSMLSPYLRHRLITEEEVVRAVLAAHPLEACEKFVQEVLWRTYWKGWLEQRPSIWDGYRSQVLDLEQTMADDDGLAAQVAHACAGETGIECFDTWAHELTETGYLHNHARMWFASIWVFTLGLPWALGAQFFARHLLDGDPASNTLSWRWVCGLQTKGKNYVARPDNIARFTEDRFQPRGLAESPEPLRWHELPRAMPLPQPDSPDRSLKTGLLITANDLHPESLVDGCAVHAIATVRPPANTVDARVHGFRMGALTDAGGRAANHWQVAASALDGESDFVRWISDNRLEQVVMPYTTVGPIREALQPLRAVTEERVRWAEPRRDWDSAFWPRATRGFFALKKTIAKTLGGMGIL